MAILNLIFREGGVWQHLLSPINHNWAWIAGCLAGSVFLGILSWKVKGKRQGEAGPSGQLAGESGLDRSAAGTGQADPASPLAASLNSDNPAVRAKAARSLGEIKDSLAVEPLINALKDQDRNVRFWSAWALGIIKDPRGVAPLIDGLRDPDEGVRYRAAEALGEIKDHSAIEPLKAALKDSGEGVRQVAAWALKQITSPQPSVAAADTLQAVFAKKSDDPHEVPWGRPAKGGPRPLVPTPPPAGVGKAPRALSPETIRVIRTASATGPSTETHAPQRMRQAGKPGAAPFMPPLVGVSNEAGGGSAEMASSASPPHPLPVAAGEGKPKAAEAHYLVGLVYSEMGRWDDAIVSYKKAIQCKPDLAEAYCNLGLAYSQTHHYPEALVFLKEAVRLKPGFARAYNNLGVIHGQLGNWADALSAFNQALLIKPDEANSLYNSAIAYLQQGHWPEARAAFKRLLLIRPDDPEAHRQLGLVNCLLRLWPEALSAFAQALALTPDEVEIIRSLGKTYAHMGRLPEALSALQQALDLDPNDPDTHRNLGAVYSQLGRWEDALAAFQQVTALGSEDWEALGSLGVIHSLLGRWQEAALTFQQAARLKDPGRDNGDWGQLATQPDRWDEMATTLKQAVNCQPDLSEAQYLLGLVSSHQGRWQEAAMAFSRPVLGDLYFGKGQQGSEAVVRQPGYRQVALAFLSRFLQIKPDFPNLGHNLELMKDGFDHGQNRLETSTRSIQANPQDVEAYHELGQT